MKILHINAVYGVGSTGTIVKDLMEISEKNGIDSYVAYSTGQDIKTSKGYVIGNNIEKKVHALLSRITGKQGYYSRWGTKKLLKYITQINPDIVHLHNLHSNYINLNILLKFLAGKNIKTVVTLHDCWFYTGGCFHYTSVNCNRWQNKCGECPNLKRECISYLKDNTENILYDRKQYFGDISNLYVVGVSKWIEQEARKTIFSNNYTTHIYNGIDMDFFKPTITNFRKKYDLEEKCIILGMANKFFLNINANTFKYISDNLKKDEVLVIVGCDKDQIDGLPKNVVGIPYIYDKNELRDIYSTSDIFVNCTREESLSLVNIEVQACGTPVITYSSTGVKETVDGICGYAVEVGNPIEIINSIAKIRNMNYESLSFQCREWVKKHFEVSYNYRKYIDLYCSIEKEKNDENK